MDLAADVNAGCSGKYGFFFATPSCSFQEVWHISGMEAAHWPLSAQLWPCKSESTKVEHGRDQSKHGFPDDATVFSTATRFTTESGHVRCTIRLSVSTNSTGEIASWPAPSNELARSKWDADTEVQAESNEDQNKGSLKQMQG